MAQKFRTLIFVLVKPSDPDYNLSITEWFSGLAIFLPV
jgi:hypothetical protein